MACVFEYFRGHVADRPEAIAVDDGTRCLSYADLAARSDDIAGRVLASAPGTAPIVAVVVNNGLDLIPLVLGIMKAKATFAYCDPRLPSRRLADMITQLEPACVVVDDANQARFSEICEITERRWTSLNYKPDEIGAVSVEEDRREKIEEPFDDNYCPYILFTSGSTGSPKGVAGRYKGLAHFIDWEIGQFGVGPGWRISQLTAPGFDPFLRDVLVPLAAGGTVCIPPRDVFGQPTALVNWLHDARISLVHCVPSIFRTVCKQALRDDFFPALKFILLAGERVNPPELRTWYGVFGQRVTLVNLYGPTETTHSKFFHIITPSDLERRSIPIGKPIKGARGLIVGSNGKPCSSGQIGEIYIRTPYRSLGYFKKPELTSEYFIPNPFSDDPDDLVYRTGDYGRILDDGTLEFIGRRDDQVKVRGVRIELGDVEHALAKHPDVVEVAVVDKQGEEEAYLCAYVVTRVPLDRNILARYALDVLPTSMVPARFVAMTNLPTNFNGKIDRKQLRHRIDEREVFVEPKSEEERIIIAIWKDFLGQKDISADDNFFALGGHSFLAIQVVARIATEFEIDCPLRTLFEAPTPQSLAVRVEEAKRSGELPRGTGVPVIEADPENRHSPFPLTDMQYAYWVGRHNVFDIGGISAHNYFELGFDTLDLDRLQTAINRVIARHDMMRAIVLPSGDQACLEETPAFEIDVQDCRSDVPESVEQRLVAYRNEQSHRVLDVAKWPFFELSAFLMPDGTVRLHGHYDLVFTDAWSVRLLWREIDEYYTDPTAPDTPLTLTFRDCIMADYRFRESKEYLQSLEYWTARVKTLAPAPALPYVRRPDELESIEFSRYESVLEAADWRLVKSKAAEYGLTPSILLLAAFADALAVFTGQERFTLALTLFNRPPLHKDVNSIVGDFTSLVLLEIDSAGKGPFLQRATQIRDQLWQDLDHRHVSGVTVLRLLSRAQGGDRVQMPVVFTSALGMEAALSTNRTLQGAHLFGISQTPQVSLDHQVVERDGALHYTWDVVEALFPEGFMAELFAAFDSQLRRMTSDLAWRSSLRGLTPASHLERLAQINATAYPIEPTRLEALFDKQARQSPDRTAVFAGGTAYSYAELSGKAVALADKLLTAGISQGDIVAISLPRGLHQIAAVIAVLRVSAIYLPLDLAWPASRIAQIVESSGASWLVVESAAASSMPPSDQVSLVLFDLNEDTEGQSNTGTLREVAPGQPDDLAYIIYTSGSTGSPKGVMIEHQSAVNTILDINRRFSVGADDRVLALSSLSFDLSVYDIFGPLAVGAALVIADQDRAMDPAHWADLVTQRRVTIWNSVPALLKLAVDSGNFDDATFASLRLAMLSGDWIPVPLAAQMSAIPTVQLISLGGATEASIWSIVRPVTDVDPSWKSIPYGRPMDNQTFHVLDSRLEPCPQWVVGELFIGGAGLARGYHGREDLTNASFITHPATGERLYRTGDHGRWLASDEIEFLGRRDAQVKIHGHRIELGEIESVLATHPDVQEAICTVNETAQGARRLVAYVVPVDQVEPEPESLLAYLAERLPGYMVPAILVSIDRIPLSANGKIDRAALPTLKVARPSTDDLVHGRTQTQEIVSEIWQQVLKIQKPGLQENFFELGGDSLLVLGVFREVDKRWPASTTVVDLFRYPTIATLSAHLERASSGSSGQSSMDTGTTDRHRDREARASALRLARQTARSTS